MVKITFKTVQNKLFTVDAEPSETVADVKTKIKEAQSFPTENQKLIYSGKILNDAATVGSLNIKEKDFIVVMVSKPKAAPAAAAAPSTPAPAAAAAAAASSTPAAPTTETPAAPAAGSTDTPAAASTTEAPAAAATSESAGGSGFGGGSFVTGPALQQAIDGMVEMGFPRDQVQKALRASFNNPDRAVEYLMSGNIPSVEGTGPSAPAGGAPAAAPAAPSTETPAVAPPATTAPDTSAPAQTTPAAQPASTPSSRNQGSAENLFAAAEAAMNRDRGGPAPGAAAAAGAAAGAGAGAGGNAPGLAAMANSPALQQIRDMVRENPAMIQPLLQQLSAVDPRIAQMVNQNPQALYELLGAGGLGDDGEGDDDMLGGQVLQVNLTQEEAAAVERLEALGFDRQMVLQAYMLCDKNEELAANFLFESGEEDQ